MKDIRFDNLSDDTTIMGIGSLFKKTLNSQWGINLEFSPKNETSSLRISNIPIIARKRIFNQTQEHKLAGYHLTFSVSNTQNWVRKKLSDFPIQSSIRTIERKQHCFCFSVKWQGKDDVMVYIPQLELARVLFLHDGYLSRSSLEPDYLKSEFSIEHIRSDLTQIKVMPSSGYPLKALDDSESRRFLSWILIDPAARASYESIGRYQKTKGYDKGGYRQWDFEFDPPLLQSTTFSVRGRFDKDAKCILVYEIDSILNIPADVPAEVNFYHPRSKEYIRGEGDGKVRAVPEQPPMHSIHDVDASADTSTVLLHAPAAVLEFSKPFITNKIAQRRQESVGGKVDSELGSQQSGDVSIDESVIGGVFPSADWVSESDATDDVHLYASKFDCFQSMLDELVEKYNCIIRASQLRKLPILPRCNRHLLGDGNPRCWMVVEIEFKGQIFQILEVDTSDGICSISTMLLRLRRSSEWQTQLKSLEEALVQRSLHWPSTQLKQLCGNDGFSGIPHPQTDSVHKGKMQADSTSHWAKRFRNWMAK